MNQTTLPARLSTLNQQITAHAERLAPATDHVVGEAISSLLAAGLSLPGGMAVDKAPEIYAFALSKVAGTGVRRVVMRLVRGEYNLRNRAFIPTPPEFAAFARSETKELVEDLARLKAIRDSMTPAAPNVKDAAAKARVRALLNGLRKAREDAGGGEGGQPVHMPISPDRADFLEMIKALPDAPVINAEQHEMRRRVDFELEQFASNERAAA